MSDEPMNITESIRCALARHDAGYAWDVDSEAVARLLAAYDKLTVSAQGERMWCKACGTVTRDGLCDCNRWGAAHEMTREPNFINYADAMQESARELAIEQCAKIADPWPGFNVGQKISEPDLSVIEVRTKIAAAIRALAPSSTDDKLAAGTGPASRGGPSPESASPSTGRVCAKCGCETQGEEALVSGEIWCHPCADMPADLRWEVRALLQKIYDLIDAEDAAEPLDDAIAYAKKAIAIMDARQVPSTLLNMALDGYKTAGERAALRWALGNAAALCDGLARDIAAENRGRGGKGAVTKLGLQLEAIAKRCGDEIWAMREKIDVSRS